MDDYALQQELEALAGNAFDPDGTVDGQPQEPISKTMSRWQKLFGLGSDDAIERIQEHRNNLSRIRVSQQHWETVRAVEEARGYDRETYEYELETRSKYVVPAANAVPSSNGPGGRLTYLVEMSGLLDSVEKVQTAAGIDASPSVVDGHSVEDSRAVSLCCVDAAGRAAILRWAVEHGHGFVPNILVDPRSMR